MILRGLSICRPADVKWIFHPFYLKAETDWRCSAMNQWASGELLDMGNTVSRFLATEPEQYDTLWDDGVLALLARSSIFRES